MMMTVPQLIRHLGTKAGEASLSRLYGKAPETLIVQKTRYVALLERFMATFLTHDDVALFSAPGRTEIGGNHTDHQNGRVLAAAVDLDAVAVASPNPDGVTRIHSEGYVPLDVRLDDLSPFEGERNTPGALVRGICARLSQLGHTIGGFDACLTSAVPTGSGLSSSASFEMLIAAILNHLYNGGGVDKVTLAKAGEYAEVHYFGKPSGLMDQMTSIMGGFVMIDFSNPENPIIHRLDFDFTCQGYTVVIVETGGSHAEMIEEYAAVSREMQAVAHFFGKNVLREVPEDDMLADLAGLRARVGDRAVLRALHFFGDNQRVVEQMAALKAGDFKHFLELVNESGRSSWMLLQNCYPAKKPQEQGIPLALALTEHLLKEKGGAWRVHGGGFAGTIQAFVPNSVLGEYVSAMERIFGKGTCHPLCIRPAGACRLEVTQAAG